MEWVKPCGLITDLPDERNAERYRSQAPYRLWTQSTALQTVFCLCYLSQASTQEDVINESHSAILILFISFRHKVSSSLMDIIDIRRNPASMAINQTPKIFIFIEQGLGHFHPGSIP